MKKKKKNIKSINFNVVVFLTPEERLALAMKSPKMLEDILSLFLSLFSSTMIERSSNSIQFDDKRLWTFLFYSHIFLLLLSIK